MTSSKPRIFVQIASYRDPECHHTIRDLFEQAANPERIFVGVCWQYDPKEDADYIAVPYPRAGQVRVIQYHVKDAKGAGWARMQAQTMWAGEEYIMQIQAHHRFEKGWDETLIELLNKCPSKKPVLTAWLPGYFPPEEKTPLDGMLPIAMINRLGGGNDAQMVHLIKRMRPASEIKGKILPTPIWVGNFMFTRAETIKEVPFDPYIYFWGEEINYSVRLFTHGYDIFHLDRVVAYHYWERAGVKGEKIYRDYDNEKNQLSLTRNLHLLNFERTSDAQALEEIQKYSLGKARKLEDFWKFSGIDFSKYTISKKAREGAWSEKDIVPIAEKSPHDDKKIFVAIAAHRDPEISPTLADMFGKAKNPDRIFVGICLQYDEKAEPECGVKSERMSQIKIHQVHYDESKGANWARHTAVNLRGKEEYILQIDSHMRFEQDWDETLIDMLARCPSDKPVISAYLPNYDPPDIRDYLPGKFLRIRVRKFGRMHDPQLLHITGQFVSNSENERSGLYPSPFCVGNFMFAYAGTYDEVPIDPHFHFYGDEISYAARLWTHGYDIFQVDELVMFHYWVRKDRLHLQHYRNPRSKKSAVSLARVCHLLDLDHTDDTKSLLEIDKYGLGSKRKLADLWEFAGIDWKKRLISEGALEGKWNMAARKKAVDKKDIKAALPRIFVQIASYRDPECQWTVKDIFEKATHPERIFVGICWQFIKEEDDICFKEPYPRPKQVRVHEVYAKESRGACWARSLTQKMWQGEEFTMQIDSHMRFEPGWDETLISMWNECENDKAVLTCYPPGYTPPNDLQRDWIFGMSAKEFDKHGIFLMKGAPSYKQGNFPAKPMPGAFLSGCMYFGPAQIIKDVPYDPHMYFFGEEISMAVRLWTSGYDLYYPNKLFIYHDWDRGKRPTHFSDHRDWGKLNDLSFARVKHMLGTEKSDNPEVLKELDKFGLGKARSLAEYQEFSGVDFSSKTFNERAEKGDFSPLKKLAAGEKPRIYVQIASYRDMECQWTVKDLFEKAKYPDRVTVGICWQFDEEQDKACFEVSTRPDQVRIMPVDWREAEGVCWARNLTQQMWEGEEYTLQIDSHMRFVPGWDELMIAELDACESAKPVLSCSPASYIPPDKLEQNPRPTIRRVLPFFPDGNIRGKGEAVNRVPEKPLNAAFVAAGFVFARSNIISEVPYDPYLYFDQEEITYAARLYTHGWDVFSSRKPLLYHYYNVPGESVRPLHWNDLRKEDDKKIAYYRMRGLNRFNHMTGYKTSPDLDAIKELAVYGFGRVRTLQQFEEYSGVDFRNKIATEKALRCLFIKDLAKYRDDPVYVPELDGAKKVTPAKPFNIPVGKTPDKAISILEPGDFVPMFSMDDTHGRTHNIETHGGKHGILVFLPYSDEEYIANFFRHFHELLNKAEKKEIWLLFIIDASVNNLQALKNKLKLPQILTADPNRVISRAFGISKPGDVTLSPVGYLLNNNLQITERFVNMPAAKLAESLVNNCNKQYDEYYKKNNVPKVVSQLPPVLIVPNAFSKEFCQRCIAAFKNGHTFEGTVGAEEKLSYAPKAKVRTDYIVNGELLREIDDKLSRSLFPEIKKIFGFEVTHREFYKIGLYKGEKGGFFRQHRDNFDAPLGYRRIAMTLHLSDDYEGGGLHFPEYDENIYRPEMGSAIAFSCATLHEARPVTKGERYVLVAFLHGREEEAYRRDYQDNKGGALKIESFTPALREYPKEMKLSRDFYTEWQNKNINYEHNTGNNMTEKKPNSPFNVMVAKPGAHRPRKVYESRQAIVYDDFLPENLYERLYNYALRTDYEHINTKGKITRAWHVHDGFPLRSLLNVFYYPDGTEKPKGDYVYPTKTDMDLFIDSLLAIQPEVENFIGKMGTDWAHVSATNWIYPHGTGLTLHDDGSGVYSGAYAYFLNPVWKSHWGGLNIMLDEEANKKIHEFRNSNDQMEFYQKKWLNGNNLDELLMENGFGKCIFPKKNRIVFIANDAYHMVTRVNEACGDNLRMSIAGFYNRKKNK